ncbi:putative nuclease HARBI1 [Orchesella cincta]|uniref:Putative nuclease HARBI1 n=1 Tax=Orchesella cincta TaxID=48709 RepID=A0A1D2N2M5_ORCCI|nr:putative nuclease HARBI1 [Orchesella cincta]
MAVPLFVLQNERRKVYKRRKLFEHLSDFEIQVHTGLPAWGAREILRFFDPLEGKTTAAIPLETKVLCYLAHLRSGSFQWCLGSLAGISQPSVSRIIEECLSHTLSLKDQVIIFPDTPEEINRTKQAFYNVDGFPNVLGVIDGTHIPIKAPVRNEPVYVCRKQFHSVNTQVICGADYKFYDIIAAWPGSTHDSFIYTTSGIKGRIYRGEFGDGWLLGDSGYPLEERLLTPYPAEVDESHRNFNRRHKKTRSTVERAIGTWKSRFRSIDKTGGTLCYEEGKACRITVATAILHNICLTHDIPLTIEDEHHRDNVNIPGAEAEAAGNIPGSSARLRREAVLIRQRLATSLVVPLSLVQRAQKERSTEPKRSPNWSEGEKLALSAAAKTRHSYLVEKVNPSLTARDKKSAWNEVVDEVNAVSSNNRTLAQIQEKYRNLRKEVKAAEAKRKRNISGTGGGSVILPKVEPWYENILATLSYEAINGIKGGIDTSNPERGKAPAGDEEDEEANEIERCERLIASATQNSRVRASESESIEIPTQTQINATPKGSSIKIVKRKRATEDLLEEQVMLFGRQLTCMEEIRDQLKDETGLKKKNSI